MSGWIFTIIGWLFSHTAATQLCSNTLSEASCLLKLRAYYAPEGAPSDF